MDDHFDPDTPDTIWVPQVGAKRWIILSKDTKLRNNNIELMALLKANTHSFLMTAQQQRGCDMAAAFVSALHDMKQIVAKEPSSVVSTVSSAGRVRIHLTQSAVIKKIAGNAAEAERIAEYEAKTFRKYH